MKQLIKVKIGTHLPYIQSRFPNIYAKKRLKVYFGLFEKAVQMIKYLLASIKLGYTFKKAISEVFYLFYPANTPQKHFTS